MGYLKERKVIQCKSVSPNTFGCCFLVRHWSSPFVHPFPLSGESIQIKKGANNIGVKIGQV
jgi:hypothetical protein